MRRALVGLALAALTLGTALEAQPPRGLDAGGARRGNSGAEFFLGRTGELRLTDAQVVRLAAIARRSAERRRALRASFDSLAPADGARRDSAQRAARMQWVRSRMEREQDQAAADMRDALSVLTAEQQAMAWQLRSRDGYRGARGARRMGFRRDGPGHDRGPRMRGRATPRPPGAER